MNLAPLIIKKIWSTITKYQDFPIVGYQFLDLSPLLLQPELMQIIITSLAHHAKTIGADVILGPESWGFIFGHPTAIQAQLPFAIARKPGKLPGKTVALNYDLAYGSNTFHLNYDAIKPGQKVLIIDDILATGGTTKCLSTLVTQLGGVVIGSAYLIEFVADQGRKQLSTPVFSLIKY